MDPKQFEAEARAHKAQGKHAEAIAVRRQMADASPQSGIAQHNLGVALADGGRWKEAEGHFLRATALGVRAAETYMMLGRCRQWLARFDDAERSFLEALTQNPLLYDAQRDLAQLRWMRTGDIAAALSTLEATLRTTPGAIRLHVLKAQILEYAGDLDEAYYLLAALSQDQAGDAFVATAASQIAALRGETQTALDCALRAAGLAPAELISQVTLAAAFLGAGKTEQAESLITELRISAPQDQHVIALQATAWRILGDPRYRPLYDYDKLVRTYWIGTPKGWRDRDAYLEEVAVALRAAHGLRAHPFGQSVRHGTQVPDVMHIDNPALNALPEAFDGAISTYIAEHFGDTGSSPDYRHQGMWSIRTERGGFHADHVHPHGWISSACYVEIPDLSVGQAGWIRFGKPGVPTGTELAAEHYVQPERGKVVLFPSYMWHGTEQNTAPGPRMTVAFDIARAS